MLRPELLMALRNALTQMRMRIRATQESHGHHPHHTDSCPGLFRFWQLGEGKELPTATEKAHFQSGCRYCEVSLAYVQYRTGDNAAQKIT
jgi:hypothetical protein